MSLLGHPRLLRGLCSLAAVTTAGAVALSSGSAAATKGKGKSKAVGWVYTETNDPANNQIIIFKRYANGTIKKAGAISTGGRGGLQPEPGCTPPGGCPLLDTQNEVVLTPSGTLLFAVNAGSNTITSFRTTSHGLKRVGSVPSGGTFPNSLTVHGNLLYALDTDSANIAGFRFSSNGKLEPIKGSSQKVDGALPPPVSPRQIGFDNSGRFLLVTLLANTSGPPPAGGTKGTIETYKVNAAGVAGKGTPRDSAAPLPFAFAFDGRNHAVVAQLQDLTSGPDGKTSTFNLTKAAGLTAIDTAPSKGVAPCWVVVTANSRYAYVVNTGGGAPSGATVAQYKLSPGGKLTFVGVTPALKEFARTDEALSNDSRYLYVLSPLENPGTAMPGPTSHIDEYKVQGNGTLKLIGQTPSMMAPGVSGLAAR